MSNLGFTFNKKINKRVNIIVNSGSIQKIEEYISSLDVDKVFFITDSAIFDLYGEEIKAATKNLNTYFIFHFPGERHKNLFTVEEIVNQLFKNKITSKSVICALGGGVTGNMAGFIASTVYRGIKLVHIPTTLLAQLDSAPDVKQSVNGPGVKNAIGSYKAPDLVVVDPTFLKTLSNREIKSGIAEAVKHGFAQDLAFLKFIVSSAIDGNLNDVDVLEKIIYKTISLKIDHWRKTPSKWNEIKKIERLTHLGHTIGKALEMVEIDYLTHGEAISHGMVIEFYISSKKKHLDFKSVNYAKKILEELGLLFPLSEVYAAENILKCLYSSGSSRDQPVFALLKKLGNPDTVSTIIPKKIIAEAINWHFKSERIKRTKREQRRGPSC